MLKSALAEFLGSLLLLVAMVGSGIVAEDVSGGITGLALLANALATGSMLYVLVTVFAPLSGTYFNPFIGAAMALSQRITFRHAALHAAAQIAGAIAGVWLAHLMFGEPIFQLSARMRWGFGQWTSEAVATFGLVLALFGTLRTTPSSIPAVLGLYVTGATWFTASTSFANPAVTIARSLTGSFTGIAPSCVMMFIIAQLIGAILAMLVLNVFMSGMPDE